MSVLLWAFLLSAAWLARTQLSAAVTIEGERFAAVDFDPLATAPIDRSSLTNALADQPNPEDEDLVAWASRIASTHPLLHKTRMDSSPVFLVIGVKTSVLHHFAQRQAIRQTWANATALHYISARVVFLGCESDLTSYTDPAERAFVVRAIEAEKRIFGDLLTSELHGCVDSYSQLLRKVVGFMEWVVAIQASLQYVMVVDDDVYLRVDRLVEMLRHVDTPKVRFYGGYVYQDLQPQRDPAHKNYIPEKDYPLPVLPPFVGGPHYVLSIDMVDFVVRNHRELRGLRDLDDVSFAMWLLALGVHPTHVPEFVLLRAAPCHSEAIALADLTTASVRQLHWNVVHAQSLCDGVDVTSAMRHHRGIVLPDDQSRASDTFLTWELLHDPATNALLVSVAIAVANREVTYDFVPASTPYERGLCATGASLLLAKLYITVGTAFCDFHRRKLHAFIDQAIQEDARLEALLTLPLHNLLAAATAVITVGLSNGAKSVRVFIECLMVQMYPAARILVVNEDGWEVASPDVFVLSIMDTIVTDGVSNAAQLIHVHGHHSRFMMIARTARSPPWSLDPRVTLITTLEEKTHRKQLYLPAASTMFAKSIQHTPLELRHPFADLDLSSETKRQFCAYCYMQYDPLRQQHLVDLLNEIEAVDAGGACQGNRQNPLSSPTLDASSETVDAMIAHFTTCRFVVAFEDAVVPGYVTEKIVEAFLAGAVPIYYGHLDTVMQLFNRDAFVDCATFGSLRECAQHVRAIHESPAKYHAMKSAPPVSNRTAFVEAFGWHPVVANALGNTSPVHWVRQLKQLLESD